jgi:hypothetical protein
MAGSELWQLTAISGVMVTKAQIWVTNPWIFIAQWFTLIRGGFLLPIRILHSNLPSVILEGM